MNSNDISRLSYKELQALALRYRVPGNIKKKLLVKVIQAARSGNDNEVGRLLQDLKQNRKRRTKRMKPARLGLTSTPLHSPNSDMADDYYCPPQQSHQQWIGAEEEIVSREEEGRIPNYEEFKQFLLRRMQREYHVYDTNHNQVHDSGIVDLRTATASSSFQTISMDAESYQTYQRSNLVAVNNTESFVYQPIEQVEYQTLEESNTDRQGPKLLKKLLQAPVGANLGEIVSPELNGYRFWSMEQCQANVELDNSDTLTAESENNDEEGNLEGNQEYYGFLTGIRGEYFLNEPAIVRNVDEIGQQISTVLNNENQHRYHPGNVDTRHYENWTVTNVMEGTDQNYVASDGQSSKIFQTMYYDNPSESLNKPQEDSVHCQYRVIDTVHSYNSSQNILNINPSEEAQYYESSLISQVPPDTQTYTIQNLVKYNSEGEYLHNPQHYGNTSEQDAAYGSTVSQTFSTGNHYGSGLQCEYSYAQEGQQPFQENLEQPSCSSARTETQKDVSDKRQTAPGILDPFWPRRTQKNSPTILENVLNFNNAKRIDLARLDQTSCVYCYIAPVVTHSPVSSSPSCSQKEKFVAEYRQHCFSPYWMLYNDTSCGTRMASSQPTVQSIIVENSVNDSQIPAMISTSNSETKDSTEKSEESMNWANEYTNYDLRKEQALCEEMDVEATDCLLPVLTTDPLDPQPDNLADETK